MYQNLMDTMSKNVEAMFDTAKMEEAMKPVTDMIELNKKTLETLTEKQTALVKSLFDGSESVLLMSLPTEWRCDSRRGGVPIPPAAARSMTPA